jgi:hypothetical protein
VRPYLERRLWVAQGGVAGLNERDQEAFWRIRFSASAVRAIATLSGGNPRMVSSLAEGALEACCARRQAVLDASDVLTAARERALAIPFRVTLESRRWVAAAAVLLATAGILTGSRMLYSSLGAARATSAATAVAATPPEPAFVPLVAIEGFTVVAGSFRSPERASAFAARVGELGLPAFTRATDGPWHQVVVGPYATRDEAQTAQRQLGAAKIMDSKIVATAPDAG